MFYKKFSAYKELLKLPTFYYGFEYDPSHSNGLILMEDLSLSATTTPMIPGFTHLQILSIVDELVKFNSISWLHPKWKDSFTATQLAPFSQESLDFFIMTGNKLKLVRILKQFFIN